MHVLCCGLCWCEVLHDVQDSSCLEAAPAYSIGSRIYNTVLQPIRCAAACPWPGHEAKAATSTPGTQVLLFGPQNVACDFEQRQYSQRLTPSIVGLSPALRYASASEPHPAVLQSRCVQQGLTSGLSGVRPAIAEGGAGIHGQACGPAAAHRCRGAPRRHAQPGHSGVARAPRRRRFVSPWFHSHHISCYTCQ